MSIKQNAVIAVTSAITGAALVYFLAPEKEVVRTVEVEKQVEVIKEVIVEKIVEKRVAANVTIDRKTTETKKDGSVVVTEERVVDKTETEEQEQKVEIAQESTKTKESLATSESSKPTFKPFEVIVTTSIIKPSIDSTSVSIAFQPMSRLPISLHVGSTITSFTPMAGLGFKF